MQELTKIFVDRFRHPFLFAFSFYFLVFNFKLVTVLIQLDPLPETYESYYLFVKGYDKQLACVIWYSLGSVALIGLSDYLLYVFGTLLNNAKSATGKKIKEHTVADRYEDEIANLRTKLSSINEERDRYAGLHATLKGQAQSFHSQSLNETIEQLHALKPKIARNQPLNPSHDSAVVEKAARFLTNVKNWEIN